MIAQRNLLKVDALSILIMGSDGHAYLLRRRRGSIHVSMAELAKWAERRIWQVEDIPSKEESLICSLNEAYERYLSCKEQELELSADRWLCTADRLAGRVSDLVERGHEIPKTIIVHIDKPPPLFAPTVGKRG
ncbi:MAG: hypothetical protein ABIB04_03310 [Patescibacteria group bacterium]